MLHERSIVNQQGDPLVVDVGSVVPLSAGIDVFNSFAVGSRDGQSNSLITDLVRASKPATTRPAYLPPSARSSPSETAARKPVTAPSLEQKIATGFMPSRELAAVCTEVASVVAEIATSMMIAGASTFFSHLA